MTGMDAVAFVNRNEQRLVGIMHWPDGPKDQGPAVILLSPGVKNRVAPHRLYNKMAASFVGMGFPVLRFDFNGLGDSEGEISEALLADLYGSIQVGRYVEDTWDAMDWLRREYGLKDFILGGLCGGAITGVLAGASRPDVRGILALGLPVILDGTDVDKTRYMTVGQLERMRTNYLRKVADPRSWLRLLSLKSDVRLIIRSLVATRKTSAPAPVSDPGNTNPLFAPAFLKLLQRGIPALLIFSEMDRLSWEFEEKFLAHQANRLRPFANLFQVALVKGANHVFTFEEWQSEMLERSGAWLKQHAFVPGAAHRETLGVETSG